MPFWRNDASFAIWPLALFYCWPHMPHLLWLQDIEWSQRSLGLS